MNHEAKPMTGRSASHQGPETAQAPASPPLAADVSGEAQSPNQEIHIANCGEFFEAEFVVLNSMGLHVRPATNLATMAGKYRDTKIWLVKDEHEVDAKVPLLILTLAGVAGTRYKLRAQGLGAEKALTELLGLAHRRFDVEGD
jgi:phosphotransferase system HPr (HPr) family protein